jgi:hypothetical protein
MKRRIVAGACFIVAALVACAELFDEPSQCKSDRDCTKFGGVCDVARAVCVPAPSVPGGEGGSGDSSIDDASEEAPPPPPPGCDAPSKDTAEITTTAVPDAAGDSEIGASITLDCTKDWILKDRAFVKPGVTVTIQPGTRILALPNAALVVQRGAKLEASGVVNQPIVFTASGVSPAAGAWRGLYLLGNAPNNGTYGGGGTTGTYAYGGSQAADSSGTLKYVRVEYATDGLVLGGVGSGTSIDYVQVRRPGATQCFAIAGGRFNAKHLVCQYPGDEMFEITNGYDGKIQFAFGHKAPTGGGHNGLLVDTGAFPKIFNMTLCGEANGNTSIGFQWRNNGRFDVANAIFTNWGVGVDYQINNGSTPADPLTLRNSIVADNGTNPAFAEVEGGTPADNDNGFDELAWFGDGGALSVDSAGLVGCHDVNNLQPYPPAVITGVAPPNDGFFDNNANYIGAFRDQNDGWMKGNWAKLTDP